MNRTEQLSEEVIRLYKRNLFLTKVLPNKALITMASIGVFMFCNVIFGEHFFLYLASQLGLFIPVVLYYYYIPNLEIRCALIEKELNS